MAKSTEPPVHIRTHDRARPPGQAGEAIVSAFVDIADELGRAMGRNWACPVSVAEEGQSFIVRIELGAGGSSVAARDGLFVIDGLPDEGGETTTRRFTIPDDLEQGLIDARVDDGLLEIKLPRTAETTTVVRQLEQQASR